MDQHYHTLTEEKFLLLLLSPPQSSSLNYSPPLGVNHNNHTNLLHVVSQTHVKEKKKKEEEEERQSMILAPPPLPCQDPGMLASLEKDREELLRLQSRNDLLKDQLHQNFAMVERLQQELLETQAKLVKVDNKSDPDDSPLPPLRRSHLMREKDNPLTKDLALDPPRLIAPLQSCPDDELLEEEEPPALPPPPLPHCSSGSGILRVPDEISWKELSRQIPLEPFHMGLVACRSATTATATAAAATTTTTTARTHYSNHYHPGPDDCGQSSVHGIRYLQRKLAELQGKLEPASGVDRSGSHIPDCIRLDIQHTDRYVKDMPTGACQSLLLVHGEENELLLDETSPQGSTGKRVKKGKDASMADKKRSAADRVWDYDTTMSLLSIYEDVWVSLNQGYLKAKDWERVTTILNEKMHQNLDPSQVRYKIDNMKKQYKKERELCNRTGSSRSLWPYFEPMNVVMGKVPKVSSLSGGFSGQGGSAPVNVEHEEEEEEEEDARNMSASFHNWPDITEAQAGEDDVPTCEDNGTEPLASPSPIELIETDGDDIPQHGPGFHGQKFKRRRKLMSDQTKDITEALESLAEALKDSEGKRLAMEKSHNDLLMAMNEQRLQFEERMEARRDEMSLKLERMRQQGQIEMLKILTSLNIRPPQGSMPNGNPS